MTVRNGQISIVLPARNEEATVASVVIQALRHSDVAEVIVIDNKSQDRTAVVAAEAGAKVLRCDRVGVGAAMKAGVLAAGSDYILRSDADISNWNVEWVDLLLPAAPGCLNRGIYSSPYSSFPMSNFVVRPFLNLFSPEWNDIPIPTTGTYLFDRRVFDWLSMPDGWAIDIAILLASILDRPELVRNINIGDLVDRKRPSSHYIPMATELTDYLTRFFLSEIIERQSSRLLR